MPGQVKRVRGASRGGRGGGGRGGGGRGTSRGRSSSRVVGRSQNDDSFPPRGGNAKRGRGGAGRGQNPDRRWRKESGRVHSNSGQEMKEPSMKMLENQQIEAVNVEEASKTSIEQHLISKKVEKSFKKKADFKASESPVEGPKTKLPADGKMPELRKPEVKPVLVT